MSSSLCTVDNCYLNIHPDRTSGTPAETEGYSPEQGEPGSGTKCDYSTEKQSTLIGEASESDDHQKDVAITKPDPVYKKLQNLVESRSKRKRNYSTPVSYHKHQEVNAEHMDNKRVRVETISLEERSSLHEVTGCRFILC